jgi:hypothetical protein
MSYQRSSRHVPERFLRQLWKHQQFQHSQLHTTDGKPVRVLSPGILNNDGGPDFTDAQISIDDILYRGDVELHQHTDEWEGHAHHLDPKYNKVILHVVLHPNSTDHALLTERQRKIPVLALAPHLQTPYHATWESMIRHERAERNSAIHCHALNTGIDSTVIATWLRKLAVERVELKVRRFEERLKEMVEQQRLVVKEAPPHYDEIPFGINPEDLPPPVTNYSSRDFSPIHLWKQLLYEGVMEALGYSKNQEPMYRLANNVNLRWIESVIPGKISAKQLSLFTESILFGGAGLIPMAHELNDEESITRVRALRTRWKKFRKQYCGGLLTPVEWQFFRLRPENFPTVRLAGAARLIPKFIDSEFFKHIIQTMKSAEVTHKEKFSGLESSFIVPTDEFWQHHYLFRERSEEKLHVCIGKQRANEIVLNVVIPICLLYARIFRDREVRSGALGIFEHSPALCENSITNIIDGQLVRKKQKLNSPMMQQGAIQLYKCYCTQYRCEECAIGKIVFGKATG